MVGVGDAYVGRGIRGNIGDNIIINFSIIRIQTEIDSDVRIQRLKICNCLFINIRLRLVRIIFGPKSDLVLPGGIELFGDGKGFLASFAVAAGKRR